MPSYPRLATLITRMDSASTGHDFGGDVIPYLVDVWLDAYTRTTWSTNIVETTVTEFSYLFDIENERLIAAWGVSQGRNGAPRDRSRMAGHPLGGPRGYHRGHAIAHTLGGPTDINLVPQLGSVNIGPFRALERRAVATPGALYFTYWSYGSSTSQRPSSVEQGFLVRGTQPDIRMHPN